MERGRVGQVAMLVALGLALAGAAQAGLVSYWPLDDGPGSATAQNAVAGMPNATLTNMDPNTDWVVGQNGTGYALDLDGANDWVDCGTNATLNAVNNPLTASVWVKTTAPGDWFRCIFAKFGGTPFWGLGWMVNSRLGFVVRGTGGDTRLSAPQLWGLDGQWHSLVGVRGNGKITLFGDGQVLATAADPGTLAGNTATVRLGSHNASQYAAQTIDDPAIWDEPLGPQAVQALAANTATPLTLPASFSKNPIQEANPAAYWRLEETIAGGGMADLSGNDYHGNGSATGLTKGIAHPLFYDPDNRAMAFNGSTGFLATGAPILTADFAGDGSYSIELWFNAAALQQGDLLALTATGTNNHGILLETEADGRIRFLHRVPAGAAGGTDLYSSQLYTTDEWHYLAAVKDGSQMKLYIDGILDPNTATDATTVSGALDAAIGRAGKNNSALYFNGMLDEIALYDRALTEGEIYLHFTGTIPEPGTLSLVGLGVLALLRRRRRGQR